MNIIELRKILTGMKAGGFAETINNKIIHKTKKGLFKFKKKEYKLEHMVKILAGERYLTADPFEGRRRKVK